MEWTTALISAGVAAVVTLLVEYAAKPSLEARKDRLLDRHRSHRRTARACQSLTIYLSAVPAIGEDDDEESRRRALAIHGQRRAAVEAKTEELLDGVADVAPGDPAVSSLMVYLVGYLTAFLDQPSGEVRSNPTLNGGLALLESAIVTSRWSSRGARARRDIRRWRQLQEQPTADAATA